MAQPDTPQPMSVEDQILALGLKDESAETFRKLGDSDREHLFVHLSAGRLVMQTGKPLIGHTNISTGDTQAIVQE